ncbi:MAG TPA: hypothetical protein DEH78_12985 [Solibacterales bacterium]|nr:hypothetical protein [Bryobacterales bacterium]
MKWLAAALLVGAALRLPLLSDRPMHADEAMQAERAARLVERGERTYDPNDYHGPLLALLTAPAAWAAGARHYAAFDETLIRAVPAALGLALVALSYFIGLSINARTAALAALFAAVSPGLVYFSRYYIPEMLLVTLSAGALLCALNKRAIPFGICAGLMLATKETAVLALAAMLAVWRPPLRAWAVAAAVAAGLFAPVDPMALPQAVKAYALRGVEGGVHRHGPLYYFETLRFELLWLAAPLVLRFWRSPLAAYAGLLTLLYALLPYKTPWCALGFLHGWTLVSAAALSQVRREAAALGLLLAVPAWRYAFPLAAEPGNPWVYGHTTRDVYALRDAIARVPAPVEIVSSQNWWPLPWYLRGRADVRWWTRPPRRWERRAVVLVSPDLEGAVAELLYEGRPGEAELYTPLVDGRIWLRPGVEVKAYAPAALRGGLGVFGAAEADVGRGEAGRD